MSKLRIPVTLTSGINEPVVEASEVKDVSFNKNQSEINEDTGRAIGNINNLVVGEDNLVDAINVNSNSIVTLDETKANKVDVQTALDLKANKTDLNSYVNDASYDSNTKRINFKHNSTILAYIDATDFIKDGMVSNVTIENGYLVITFNTDSGQEPIRIALTDIFNPDNYYTKTAIDTKLGTLEFIVPGGNNVTNAINNAVRNINAAIGDLEEEKADKTAITSLQNTKADKADLVNKANKDGYYPRMIVGGSESLIGDVPQTATYTFRRTGGGAIGEPVARLTEIQGNTGVVNQLVQNGDFSDGTTHWTASQSTISVSDNIMTVIADSVNRGVLQYMSIVEHKYLLYLKANCPNNNDTVLAYMGSNAIASFSMTQGWNVGSTIFTGVDSAYLWLRVSHANQPYQFAMVKLCDLTLMYGTGNEPGTVAEFEQRIWRDYGKTLDEYIAYTQGKLINCKAQTLESTGQNQWDEAMELGNINDTTGQPSPAASFVRSTNFAPVLPSSNYYFFVNKNIGSSNTKLYFYRADKSFISATAWRSSGAFTTPSDCLWVKFKIAVSAYGNTYTNDICINISDAAINGTYRPYKKDLVNLNLTTLTGINPNTNVRETIFPNGAGGGEGWRDTVKVVNGAVVVIKNSEKIGSTYLGIKSYGSDAVSEAGFIRYNFNLASKAEGYSNLITNFFKTSNSIVPMSPTTEAISGHPNTSQCYIGINASRLTGDLSTSTGRQTALKTWLQSNDLEIEYQLATPIIYTDLQYADGTPFVLPRNYEVQNDGTERITHAEGEDSIAPVMSAIYGLNAVGFVQDAPKDYTSQATLDSLTSLLSSLTGHTITKTWDAANNKWTFN